MAEVSAVFSTSRVDLTAELLKSEKAPVAQDPPGSALPKGLWFRRMRIWPKGERREP